MSSTDQNALTKMYGGKFGNQMVYRNRDGVSILAKMPKKSKKEAVPSQRAVRRKFKMASRWAKNALLDPDMLARYTALASGMKSAYNMAVTNYLRPPEIIEINVSDYHGEIGNTVGVVATDDFRVATVEVSIKDSNGNLVEKGLCVEDLSADCWVFTATKVVDSVDGIVVTAIATDYPKHQGTSYVTL